MKLSKIVGWKTYAVAAVSILAGLIALKQRNIDGAVKGLIAGAALISLRDVLGKVLEMVDANRKSLDDLRAAIEAELTSKAQ